MSVSRYFDRIAISLSAICIVHCLAVPLVVAILPIAVLGFGGESHFHAVMLWLVVPISVVGLIMGYRIHDRPGIVALGMLGLIVIAIAAIRGHGHWPVLAEVVVSILGSLMLTSAHWTNFVLVRKLHVHEHC